MVFIIIIIFFFIIILRLLRTEASGVFYFLHFLLEAEVGAGHFKRSVPEVQQRDVCQQRNCLFDGDKKKNPVMDLTSEIFMPAVKSPQNIFHFQRERKCPWAQFNAHSQ